MTQFSSHVTGSNEIPRIYVACLAAYNNGKLHGVWIDALNNDADEIMAHVQAMLKCSPEPDAGDHAIHDYVGFYGIQLSEWEGFAQVHQMAQFIDEYGRLGSEVYYYYGDLAEAEEALTERYCGEYRSLADFAEELTAETTEIPENLRFYVDYERMARDMEMSGDILAIETTYDEIHVFWSS